VLLKNNKLHRINATAAPAAMKGSARAKTVIAAPVNAEERLLKVCASVSENKNCINRFARHCLPGDRCDRCVAILKK
jgi:hypothetical protein